MGLTNLSYLLFTTIATFINLSVAFVVSKGLSLNLLLLNRLREEEESTPDIKCGRCLAADNPDLMLQSERKRLGSLGDSPRWFCPTTYTPLELA